MSSSLPAPGGGPEPVPSLTSLSLSSQISSQISDGGGGGGGGDAPGAPELPLPAVGARVRCEGLMGAAELNGCLLMGAAELNGCLGRAVQVDPMKPTLKVP
jgi:hypothetical protein